VRLTVVGLAAAFSLLIGSRTATVPAASLPKATAVSAGGVHACALLSDSTVKCWGRNGQGQLGDGTHTWRVTAVAVHGLTGATAVSAGLQLSCALLADGTARCWGDNRQGQLGDGTTTSRSTPVAVQGLTRAVAISAGEGSACAVLADQTVACWGDNSRGELGNGTRVASPRPMAVPGLTDVTGVKVEDRHVCALHAGGTVSCWGWSGMLGPVENAGDHLTPTLVPQVTDAVAIASASPFRSCALTARGVPECWDASSEPAIVPGFTNVEAFSTHPDGQQTEHSCALIADGTVTCQSDNPYQGQVGIGKTQTTTPVTVTGLGGVVAISANSFYTCAALSGGGIKCWGGNSDGQLGDGTTQTRFRPVSVLGIDRPVKPVGSVGAGRLATGSLRIAILKAASPAIAPGVPKRCLIARITRVGRHDWASVGFFYGSRSCSRLGNGVVIVRRVRRHWHLVTSGSDLGSCGKLGIPVAVQRDLRLPCRVSKPARAATDTTTYGILMGVSCTSADDCIGVGTSQAVGPIGRNFTLAEKWNGRSWAILPTGEPIGADGSELYSVSCTSADACMAVGQREIPHRSLPLAEAWNGKIWAVKRTPAVASEGGFDSVSCSSPDACIATGYAILHNHNNWFSQVWNGRSWRAVSAPRPTGTTGSNLGGVSCVSRGLCMAVGDYQVNNSSKSRTLAERWNGRRWTINRTPNPRDGANGDQLADVSCGSARACVAVGGYTKPSNMGSLPLVELWNGRAWTMRPSRRARGSTGGDLGGASCRSAQSCVAVGESLNRSGAMALAEMWTGNPWMIKPTPTPSGATDSDLNDVSCGSQHTCMAVGRYATDAFSPGLPLAELWNGDVWTLTSVPL
jgi:alpha-tubulin suppressor-like RCC1 family protein